MPHVVCRYAAASCHISHALCRCVCAVRGKYTNWRIPPNRQPAPALAKNMYIWGCGVCVFIYTIPTQFAMALWQLRYQASGYKEPTHTHGPSPTTSTLTCTLAPRQQPRGRRELSLSPANTGADQFTSAMSAQFCQTCELASQSYRNPSTYFPAESSAGTLTTSSTPGLSRMHSSLHGGGKEYPPPWMVGRVVATRAVATSSLRTRLASAG